MPVFTFNKADTTENTVDELINRMKWLTARLDSKNVKRLDTNETVIKSADGTTEIAGPVLVQKDSMGTTRLKQGYDSSSGDFVFQMSNSAGQLTVDIDSNGDLVVERGTFKGSITIGTGDTVFKSDSNGIYLGNAVFANAPFRVDLNGNMFAESATITDGVITGGTFRTAVNGERIEISSDQLKTYDSSDDLNGIVTNSASGSNYGDVYLYDSGTKVLEIYNNLAGTGFSIRPANSADLNLGRLSYNTNAEGNWTFVNNIAFFGGTPTSKDSVSNMGSISVAAGSDTINLTDLNNQLSTIENKINELIDALQSYNLV